MLDVSGLILAELADELEDACLQRHNQYGADAEGRTHQEADDQNSNLDTEFDSTDGSFGELLADDYHQGISGAAAEGGLHIEDGCKSDDRLTGEGQKSAKNDVAGGLDKAENREEHLRKGRDEDCVEQGAEAQLALTEEVDGDDYQTDGERSSTVADAGKSGDTQ